jgi:hypothetical protein
MDGSFCATDGTGGTVMVLRDETGSIIVSACSFLSSCSSPLHAELESYREGIAVAREWSTLPCLIEMDYLEAVKLIKQPGIDRSMFMGIVQEIKEQLVVWGSLEIGVISREQNKASHVLANMACTLNIARSWPSSGPDEVLAMCRLSVIL